MGHNYWAWELQLLSLCAKTTEAHQLQSLQATATESTLCDERSHCSEKRVYLTWEEPRIAATRESLYAAMKTQHGQK